MFMARMTALEIGTIPQLVRGGRVFCAENLIRLDTITTLSSASHSEMTNDQNFEPHVNPGRS